MQMIIKRWICRASELVQYRQALIQGTHKDHKLPESLDGSDLEIKEFPNLVKLYWDKPQIHDPQTWQSLASLGEDLIKNSPWSSLDTLQAFSQTNYGDKLYLIAEPYVLQQLESCDQDLFVNYAKIFWKRFKGGSDFYNTVANRTFKLKNELHLENIYWLVRILWTANYSKPNLYQAMAKKALSNLGKATDSQLVSLVQAFIPLGQLTNFIEKSKGEINRRLSSLSLIHRSRLLRYLGKEPDYESLKPLIVSICDDIVSADSREIANLCDIMGHYRWLSEYLKPALTECIVKNRSQLRNPKDIMLILNSYHELDDSKAVVSDLLPGILASINDFQPKELGLIVYILGIAEVKTDDLWEVCKQKFKLYYKNADSHVISLFAFGFYKVGKFDEEIFNCASGRVMELGELSSKALWKLITACRIYPKSDFFWELREAFKLAYEKYDVNKALVYIDIFIRAEQVDKELLAIFEKLKARLPKPSTQEEAKV
ncbi:unnamed protein product [Blepharisma stoltei]|uniref:Uncharacterized protein n=1 Tax=Blepharisma stoltei TaxID=1481888 RepID=A0AAU9K2I0_9CILI|nr:unnamed protein product [Blepharisma stoltei]